ncbi:MAG TPA: DUF4249 family protein [Cyclobacteriaceae bacterium]|nr:DUF4249 family protein [Cyclobacteriaceae bacterium]
MSKGQWIWKWIVVFLVVSACVEPATYDIPPPSDLVIIDGMIHDGPGPYTVKISKGRAVTADSTSRFPVMGATVILYEDTGIQEQLVERKAGEYSTGGIMQGRVGHSYHVKIKMPDGNALESEPEEILPGGEIEEIRYEYEARTETKEFGEVASDVFNIFIDSHASTEVRGDSYIRWRLTGTYKVVTSPELHTTFLQQSSYRTPWPCSGFVIEPALGGGKLVQRSECICCTCWLKYYETKPQLSDTEFVEGGQFRNVKVGEVPVTPETFSDRYVAEVEQMPISKVTYDFFKVISIQKESATNLFQPPPGRVFGNIKSNGSPYPVIGLFWATSMTRKKVTLTKTDLPYVLQPMDIIAESCLEYFANSTTIKPSNWDE